MNKLKFWQVNNVFSLLAAMVVFLSVIEIFAIACSLMEIGITQAMAAGILAAAAGLAAIAWLHTGIELPEPAGTNEYSKYSEFIMRATAGAGAAFFLLLCVAAYICPDMTCDGNTYHIPAMSIWAQKGYIHWVDPLLTCSQFANGYPKAAEVVSFVFVQATGDSHLVNMQSLYFLPIGVAGLAVIAIVLGAEPLAAMFGAGLFVFVPVNITQSMTTYVDSAFASTIIAFFAMVMALMAPAFAGRPIRPTQWILTGLAGGLAIAIKPTGVAVVCVAMVFVVCILVYKKLAPLTNILLGCAVVAAGIIAVAGYWYIRNWWYGASPLYPVGVQLAGLSIFPGPSVGDAINSAENTPRCMRNWSDLLRIIATWSQFFWSWPATIVQEDSRFGGLGFVWAIAAVPSVIWASMAGIRRQNHWQLFWMLLAMVVAAFIITPMHWWPRYTVWIYAVGIGALALALSRMPQKRLTAAVLVISFAAIAEGATCFYLQPNKFAADPLLNAGAGITNEMRLATVVRAIDSLKCRTIAVGPMRSEYYPGRWKGEILGGLSMPLGKRKICGISPDVNAAQIKELKAKGVDCIICDASQQAPAAMTKIGLAIPLGYSFSAYMLK